VASLSPPRTGGTAPPAANVADAQALRAQGDESLRQGDISTARLLYQRAAEAGDGEAALLLGHTYNPAFLSQLGVRGLRGDLAQAALWYRRARDLGDKDADIALRSLPNQ
jgi:TPR repeat protein